MPTNLDLIGVNLSGAEFSPPSGSYYQYPTQSEIDYEAFKGMSVIRVPVEWERLQPSLGGALDGSQLSQLDAVVARATQDGLKVVIDLHNYGKYDGNLIGSGSVSSAQFADFWQKMAEHYSSNPNVIYGLMNEPAQTDAQSWLGDVNAAIDAIRYHAVDGAKAPLSSQEVLVSGINYDHADTWVGSANADVIGKGVVDPLHNYAFDVHQYLDSDGSGTHFGPVADADGTDKVSAVTSWARSTEQKLFLGEIGVPNDGTSLQALDNVLGYLNNNADVWQGAAYWAAGPLWKPFTQDGQTYSDYPYSAEPTPDPNNTANDGYDDKPQQAILEKYAHQMEIAGISITSPGNGADVRVPTITGRGTSGSMVTVTVVPANGGAAASGSVPVVNGAWTYMPAAALPDGTYTVRASRQSPGGAGTTVATESFTLDTTTPVVSSPTLMLAANSGRTPLGIAAPSDNLTAAGSLAITAGSLPIDGTVTLADGTTRIVAGEVLTAAQLQGLQFEPAPGVLAQASAFTYTVTDGAGNSAVGAAALNVGAAAVPTVPSTGTGTQATTDTAAGAASTPTGPTPADPAPTGQAPPDAATGTVPTDAAIGTAPTGPGPSSVSTAPDAVSISPGVSYDHGVFTLSGTASSAAGVSRVEMTATLANGAVRDLGAATVDGQGNFTFADRIGRHMQGFITATETDGAGVTASGTAAYSLTGGLSQDGFTAEQNVYTDDGSMQLTQSRFRPNGSKATAVLAPGLVLSADDTERFSNNHLGDNTFVYDPGHGFNVVEDFRLRGAQHDTLSFSSADFGDSVADVLRHSFDAKGGSGVVILDPASHDAVQLSGIDKGQLAHNQGDISLHP